MNKITKIVTAAASAVALIFLAASPANAAPNSMRCVVNGPISAAALNAPNDGYWSFEVFNARPDTGYKVKVQWAGDPSNAGHPNTGILTDSTGHGVTSLQRYWTPDGFLPGYFIDQNSSATLGNFVAIPGKFSVQVGPSTDTGDRAGKTTCAGVVTE